MSNNRPEENNKEAEKKNFTEILSDKAEKAGEAAGEAVKKYTQILSGKEDDTITEAASDIISNNNKGYVVSKKLNISLVTILLIIYDVIAVVASYFLALWIRFDGSISNIESKYIPPYLEFIPFYAVFCIIVFAALKLYKSIWKYASVIELVRVVVATFITGFFHIIVITAFFLRMPLSYYLFGPIIQFFLIIGIRFFYRFYLILRQRYNREAGSLKRVMIIGAGEAGRSVIREIVRSEEMSEIPVCIIDGDQTKWNKSIEGVPVVGGRESILLNVEKYKVEKIYYCIPSSNKKTQRDILSICNETSCELKILPGIYQIATGEVDMKDMKDVAIEDLLGRDPVKVNMDDIYNQISGKVVLITGGGGSIGSEIALQVSRHNPKKLIIFDIYENNAYSIRYKILKENPKCPLEVLIGSVRDSRRVNDIFRRFRPDIVYHAAAHKHVPLMEDSPCEAIKNNVIGTYKVAYAAMMYGTQRFVLISTDKAVNPTNVMGASKRLCELVIQSFDKKIKAHKESELPVLHVHQEDC